VRRRWLVKTLLPVTPDCVLSTRHEINQERHFRRRRDITWSSDCSPSYLTLCIDQVQSTRQLVGPCFFLSSDLRALSQVPRHSRKQEELFYWSEDAPSWFVNVFRLDKTTKRPHSTRYPSASQLHISDSEIVSWTIKILASYLIISPMFARSMLLDYTCQVQ
jgi:hypothetical protein